jgi:hypothetical protein
VGTDIYGGIEFRHPLAGTEFYDGEPWIAAMDLWPLYDEIDYAAFGCLFGVRNDAGFRPLAAGRGLPPDLSGGLREHLAEPVAAGHMNGASWVGWAELSALDPASAPARFVGRLTWSRPSRPSLLRQCLVPAVWPPEVVAAVGPRPAELDSAARPFTWSTPDGEHRYEPLTAGSVLGEGTHWPHVFAVMEALSGRFGADGVRLVVAFD